MPFDKREYMREYYQRNKDKWKKYLTGTVSGMARAARYGEYSKAKAKEVELNDRWRHAKKIDSNGNKVYWHVPYKGVKEARQARYDRQGAYGIEKAREMSEKPGAKRSFKKGLVSDMFDKQAYMREYYQRNKDKWEQYRKDYSSGHHAFNPLTYRQGSYARAKMKEMNPNYASISRRSNAANRAKRDAYNRMLSRNQGVYGGMAEQARARANTNAYRANQMSQQSAINRHLDARRGDEIRRQQEAAMRNRMADQQQQAAAQAKKNKKAKAMAMLNRLGRAERATNLVAESGYLNRNLVDREGSGKIGGAATRRAISNQKNLANTLMKRASGTDGGRATTKAKQTFNRTHDRLSTNNKKMGGTIGGGSKINDIVKRAESQYRAAKAQYNSDGGRGVAIAQRTLNQTVKDVKNKNKKNSTVSSYLNKTRKAISDIQKRFGWR